MPRVPKRRNQSSIDEIIDALIVHPFFIANETVISIGTASTEPFAPGPVVESTFEIMDCFLKRGLKNPFWIVTKRGVPKKRGSDIRRIVNNSRGLMISLCWADNPAHIEPIQNDRFLNIEEAHAAGATLVWYMRPLAVEWSGNPDHIERMMAWVKENYGKYISAIVPGGLRWTEGIERGMIEVHKVGMPTIEKSSHEKDLPEELAEVILELSRKHFPNLPIYFKSSCAISKMLAVPSVSSAQLLSRAECEASVCPIGQRNICSRGPICSIAANDAQNVIDRLAIPTRVVSWNQTDGLVTDPPLENFTYALRQIVLNQLGRGR